MLWLYSKWAYALILCVSLSGLAILDWRYKLLLWRSRASKSATLATIAAMLLFYLAWDIAGIWLKVFSTNQRYVLGLYLFTPDLPIEECFFLILLTYVILLVTRAVQFFEQSRAALKPSQKRQARRGRT